MVLPVNLTLLERSVLSFLRNSVEPLSAKDVAGEFRCRIKEVKEAIAGLKKKGYGGELETLLAESEEE